MELLLTPTSATAIQEPFPYFTLRPPEENIVVPKPVQTFPFEEYATVFVPFPTVTHLSIPL